MSSPEKTNCMDIYGLFKMELNVELDKIQRSNHSLFCS